jgi:hypothetical protein
MGTETVRELQRDTALTTLEMTLADMANLRAELLRTMPGKMDALAGRIDAWCRGVAVGVRELRRSRDEHRAPVTPSRTER